MQTVYIEEIKKQKKDRLLSLFKLFLLIGTTILCAVYNVEILEHIKAVSETNSSSFNFSPLPFQIIFALIAGILYFVILFSFISNVITANRAIRWMKDSRFNDLNTNELYDILKMINVAYSKRVSVPNDIKKVKSIVNYLITVLENYEALKRELSLDNQVRCTIKKNDTASRKKQ